MLGRCELAKLGEGAPVAAYERQLLGTKGRLPYWWPSPIPLCEVAPRGGWRERGRVCQGYSAFLGWPMPSGFQPGGRLQELRFFEEEGQGEGKVNFYSRKSSSEPLSACFGSLNVEDRGKTSFGIALQLYSSSKL